LGNQKNNLGRVIGGTWNNNAQRHYYTNLRYSPGELWRLLYGRKRVVPVLFIPGFMGSRLKVKGEDDMAWDPPNNLIQSISSLIRYIFTSAEKRAKELDPDNTRETTWPTSSPLNVQETALCSRCPLKTRNGSGLDVIKDYIQIGSSFRAVKPGEIPKEAGYCMDEVLLLDTPVLRDESGWVSFTLPDTPISP
jgi:hypothetical protein